MLQPPPRSEKNYKFPVLTNVEKILFPILWLVFVKASWRWWPHPLFLPQYCLTNHRFPFPYDIRRLWPKFISSGWSVSRVLLCTGCDEALWPQAGRWHKADISQAPDAGKTLSLSSSQRLLHIFKPKHWHFSPPIWYQLLKYQQGEQHRARLGAKLWNKTFYFADFVQKGWGWGPPNL